MFINLQTSKPAWLIEHDLDVVYVTEPANVAARNHVVTGSFEFFSTHREATRNEIDGISPATKLRAVKKPAASKPKAPPKPARAARGAGKAAPRGSRPNGADKPPGGVPTPPGGEPSMPGARKLFGVGKRK